jgi:glucokinase
MTRENSDRSCSSIGIEITAAECIGVCLGIDGNILASERSPLSDATNSIDEMLQFASGFKERYGQAERIGVAIPGLIRRETGRVDYSARMPSHAGVDIAGQVKAATGMDVVLENDANAAAYAEYKLGAGRGSRHMFYATIGTGIGGALIVDGRIWHGAAGFAG